MLESLGEIVSFEPFLREENLSYAREWQSLPSWGTGKECT